MSAITGHQRRFGRRRLLQASAGILAARLAGAALAANNERKPLRLVVAGVPGAAADTFSRLLVPQFSAALGRQVIVDNRAGAGGSIAARAVVAAKDEEALLVAPNALLSELPHATGRHHDLARLLEPLAEIACAPLVLIAGPSAKGATLQEVLSWVRAQRGGVPCASYSPGSLSHVLGIVLSKSARVELVHVPYAGSAPALVDVVGGTVPLMFDSLPASLPFITSGKVRALAVTSEQRPAQLPPVPTFREAGLPELTADAWLALWATAEGHAHFKAAARTAAAQALAAPEFRAKVAELGSTAGRPLSTEDLRRRLQGESARVGAMLAAVGYKPE